MGLVSLQHVESSWTRDCILISCSGRIPNHWTIRQVQLETFQFSFLFKGLCYFQQCLTISFSLIRLHSSPPHGNSPLRRVSASLGQKQAVCFFLQSQRVPQKDQETRPTQRALNRAPALTRGQPTVGTWRGHSIHPGFCRCQWTERMTRGRGAVSTGRREAGRGSKLRSQDWG